MKDRSTGNQTIDLKNITKVVLCEESQAFLDSYVWLAKKESGAHYDVGTPQTVTWLAMWQKGQRSRSLTALHKNNAAVRNLSKDDIGAIAPLNVTPGRIITAMEYPLASRAGLRFALLRHISPDHHPDFYHWLGRLQFAIMACVRSPILDDKSHNRRWVNYASGDYKRAAMHEWTPMVVEIHFKSGSKEIWKI